MNDAIDRIAAQDWAGASEALRVLQARDDDRMRAAAEIRHEVANAVCIIQANIEGMLDGVLEPNRARLEELHEALGGITTMLERWRLLRL